MQIADARIDAAYRRTCCGIQIDIMAIPSIFAEGRRVIAAGADDTNLDVAIRNFVEGIR